MIALGVLLLVVLLSFFLAFMVWKSNPKSASNTWFALFALSIIFWSIIMYLSLQFTDPVITLFYIRLSMLAGTLLAVSAFLFAYTFPNQKFHIPIPLFLFYLIFVPATMIVSMSPYMFTHLEISGSNIEPIPGPGILMFVVTSIGSVIATFIILLYKFFKAKSLQRTQYFFMIVGILLMFLMLVTTNFLSVVIWKTSSFIFLAPVYPLLYLGSTAYAIFRHKILDIRLLLLRAVTYFITVVFLASSFAVFVLFITTFIIRTKLTMSEVILFVGLATFFAVVFQPIRRKFEAITERIFYRNTYITSEVLSDVASTVASTLVFTDLINGVGDIFSKSLKVSSFFLVLFDDKKDDLIATVKYTLPDQFNRTQLKSTVMRIFQDNPQILSIDEVEDQETYEFMKLYQVDIIMPLIVQQELIGVCFIGPNSSGDSYNQRDLDLLTISAPQIAVGIQNALSYEEIKQFNVTLQQKVDEATSQLKESNTQLVASNEKLKELDRLKDEFVSIASHELRTPLTAVKGYLWLALNKSPTPLPDPVKVNLKIAHDSTERLSHMVEDMLTISRIEGNRLKIDVAEFDINGMMKEVYDELAIRASSKSIEFKSELNSAPILLKADKEKIRECVINLTGNALKFTPEKGQVTLSLLSTKVSVNISIKDSGPGISEEDKSKLFQKFSKLENSYKKVKESGSGLGLYITKQIVDLHKGSINVESELGKGTTFTIQLPMNLQVEPQS